MLSTAENSKHRKFSQTMVDKQTQFSNIYENIIHGKIVPHFIYSSLTICDIKTAKLIFCINPKEHLISICFFS